MDGREGEREGVVNLTSWLFEEWELGFGSWELGFFVFWRGRRGRVRNRL
jgi:hypothetical protein